MSFIPITVGFGGGAETLFNNTKEIMLELPQKQSAWTIENLLAWMRDNLLKERPELFIQGDSVRPGILVLVNDVDWELVDTLRYVIKPNDNITFLSTLHGG